VPYLTSHSASKGKSLDASILWLNAAETWVEIITEQNFVDFTSATGQLDCFIFGSHHSPKETQSKLSKLTGYTAIPPWYSIGFHYSKWSEVSSGKMLD
jgi:alpha 1,3-glucosidase